MLVQLARCARRICVCLHFRIGSSRASNWSRVSKTQLVGKDRRDAGGRGAGRRYCGREHPRAGRRSSGASRERTPEWSPRFRVLNHIVAGYGSRTVEYRAGDVVLAALTEAMEWCLRG
jgi:hypothetical protein